ncbi:MAG: response regulator [Bryobacteraceae bacterium]
MGSLKRVILVVEDSKADVELIRRSLSTGDGAPTLLIADDGVEALRLLREPPGDTLPDLILLDLNLPRKSGHEVLQEVKADPVLKHIPVVVLSSSNADRDVAGAYGLHANCYFTKPMDIDRFTETLRSIEEFWFSRATLPTHG